MKETEKFIFEEYGKKGEFASFLPGISGIHGIPIWCYYVNRGQGVVSFGLQDKDHAIMEFYPAHTAYQVAAKKGFRTFLRIDGNYVEPFSDVKKGARMEIERNALSLSEEDSAHGIFIKVTYFTLPEEPIGALVRKVEIQNISRHTVMVEALDGMPALVPYGIDMSALKEMAETSKAWMQTEQLADGTPIFAIRASMEDAAAVSEVLGVHFASAFSGKGERLVTVFDPNAVFGYDKAFERAQHFEEGGLASVMGREQSRSNEVPCAFFAQNEVLEAGEKMEFYELFGEADSREILANFLHKIKAPAYFIEKLECARELADTLTDLIRTRTANPRFDEYCRYTYMDNVLRGGFPIRLGENKIFYVYSRKHGDLERDYNYFSMLPEYYSQGNGNFRDVNQNRRSDTFFTPFVGRGNIKLFYSLIQPDGYNPLGVEKKTYTVPEEKLRSVLSDADPDIRQKIICMAKRPFTPGELARVLERERYENKLFSGIMDIAEEEICADFKEGYWSDHWTYNLDLIEDYLAVFPEKEREMLFEGDYTYFAPQARVLPRARRYVKTKNGIRQYHFLEYGETAEDGGTQGKSAFPSKNQILRDRSGKVIHATLIEKLLLLCTIKFATLDPYGMGVEMEGGKPGWYDALNGLPGMLGSSMAESFELLRMIVYVTGALKRHTGELRLSRELYELLAELQKISEEEEPKLRQSDGAVMSFWNRINDAKEAYRSKVYGGMSGEKAFAASNDICKILERFASILQYGIQKAKKGAKIIPTYFAYEVTAYTEGNVPIAVTAKTMPEFLEGPVRYLKLPFSGEEKYAVYKAVKESRLYDWKLSMYKVNASLQEASIEIGRCRSFTPGWLENESVWLHMEYKYLLELLKSGMYHEFANAFYHAGIPFLDEAVYGRSTLENSSFIVSSANPNPAIHGKGFVARLSGSTAEFLSMWRLMFFGPKPFSLNDEKELTAEFSPAIPSYLIPEDGEVRAMFLGKTEVVYHFPDQEDFFPGTYCIAYTRLSKVDGTMVRCEGGKICGEEAMRLRAGEYARVDVIF